jgi:hypothetical protein
MEEHNSTIVWLNQWRTKVAYWKIEFYIDTETYSKYIGHISFDTEESLEPPDTYLTFGYVIPDLWIENIEKHYIKFGRAMIQTQDGIYYMTPLLAPPDYVGECEWYRAFTNDKSMEIQTEGE